MVNKSLAFAFIVILAVIAVIFFCKQPAVPSPEQPVGIADLVISNFNFSETDTGRANLTVTDNNGKVVFEGPITKSDPCQSLTANYSVTGNKVTIIIQSIPQKEGFGCIQVITDKFYRGSFDYTGGVLDELIVSYQGPELVKILGQVNRNHMLTVFAT